MDIPLDEVLHFGAITSDSTGAATDADSTPTWAIFEEATDTAIQTGNFTKRTSLDGHYRGTATLSAANGFEVGKWYEVTAAATVDSVAGKAIVFGPFRIVPAEAQAGVPVVDVGYVEGTGIDPSGAVDANVVTVEAGAIDGDAIAASAVTKVQSGLASQSSVDDLPTNAELATALGTADDAVLAALASLVTTIGVDGAGLTAIPSVGAVTDKTGFALASDGLDLVTAWAPLTSAVPDSIPADGSRPSIQQAAYMMTQFLVESSIAGTTLTVKKPDGSTTLFTVTLDDGTNPTSKTRAS